MTLNLVNMLLFYGFAVFVVLVFAFVALKAIKAFAPRCDDAGPK